MQYQLIADSEYIKATTPDGTVWWVPNDPANTDWQQYQAWLAADPGNQPYPAEGEE